MKHQKVNKNKRINSNEPWANYDFLVASNPTIKSVFTKLKRYLPIIEIQRFR